MTNYLAKVQLRVVDEKEKVKKVNEQYLVRGESVTDVEAIIYREFQSYVGEWELVSVTESKILRPLNFFPVAPSPVKS